MHQKEQMPCQTSSPRLVCASRNAILHKQAPCMQQHQHPVSTSHLHFVGLQPLRTRNQILQQLVPRAKNAVHRQQEPTHLPRCQYVLVRRCLLQNLPVHYGEIFSVKPHTTPTPLPERAPSTVKTLANTCRVENCSLTHNPYGLLWAMASLAKY